VSGAVLGQTLIAALLLTSVYALVALGLTLVFGLMEIVNFAQGQLLLAGAYITYALVQQGLTYWLALGGAVALAFIGGGALDAALFARVRQQPINGLLLSVALIAILSKVFQDSWGLDPLYMPTPVNHIWHIRSVIVPANRVLVIGGTTAMLLATTLFLKKTRLGMAMRAAGQHAEAAALMGIGVERIRNLAFAISAALAALGGALLAAVFPIEPALGSDPLVLGFIALILGGAGSPLGALIGATILAFVDAFTTQLWSSAGAHVVAFALLIVVLFIRPQGLVGAPRETTL
jgi:branched-chain amino acid transport system permease protein